MREKKSPSTVALDRFDVAILDFLQKDCSTPHRLIGESVNLSTAAVQRRINKLEESGVIQSKIATIDPNKIGGRITIIVEIEIINERHDLLDELKKRFASIDEIQQCYYVTGEMDFVLIITVESMAQYERLTREIFHSDSNIKKYRTIVAMDRVKVGLSLPLADNEGAQTD